MGNPKLRFKITSCPICDNRQQLQGMEEGLEPALRIKKNWQESKESDSKDFNANGVGSMFTKIEILVVVTVLSLFQEIMSMSADLNGLVNSKLKL